MNTTHINKVKSLNTFAKLGVWVLVYSIGVAMLIVSSKNKIPMYPVPITLQTLVVALIGIVLGKKAGPGVVFTYLMLGIAGLPVFAAGTNVTYTGGYLIGMVIQSFIAGIAGDIIRKKVKHSHVKAFSMLLLSFVIMFVVGWSWLAIVMNSSHKAFMGGVLPFLVGDSVKLVVAFVIMEGMYQSKLDLRVNNLLEKIKLF